MADYCYQKLCKTQFRTSELRLRVFRDKEKLNCTNNKLRQSSLRRSINISKIERIHKSKPIHQYISCSIVSSIDQAIHTINLSTWKTHFFFSFYPFIVTLMLFLVTFSLKILLYRWLVCIGTSHTQGQSVIKKSRIQSVETLELLLSFLLTVKY